MGSPAEGKGETEAWRGGRQGQVSDDVGLRTSTSSPGCKWPPPPPPVARPSGLASGTPLAGTFPLTEGVGAGPNADGPAVIWGSTSALSRHRLGRWRWLCERVGYQYRVRKRLHAETRRQRDGSGRFCRLAWAALGALPYQLRAGRAVSVGTSFADLMDTLPALQDDSRDWQGGRGAADPGWRPHGSRPRASPAQPVATPAVRAHRRRVAHNTGHAGLPQGYARCTEDSPAITTAPRGGVCTVCLPSPAEGAAGSACEGRHAWQRRPSSNPCWRAETPRRCRPGDDATRAGWGM